MFAKFKRENFFVTPFIRGVPVSFISLLESTIVQLLPPINILLKKDQDKNLLQSYFEKIDLYQRKITTDSYAWLNVSYGVGLRWDEEKFSQNFIKQKFRIFIFRCFLDSIIMAPKISRRFEIVGFYFVLNFFSSRNFKLQIFDSIK